MMRCFAPEERKCSLAAEGEELKHQGAENSALKNSAPSSLTALKTSESTSIFPASVKWAFGSSIRDDQSNEFAAAASLVEGSQGVQIQRHRFSAARGLGRNTN